MALFIIMSTIMTVYSATSDMRIVIDGTELYFEEQGPIIIDGRTLVPVRGVFEQLGFDVSWNDETRQAILARTGYIIIITIGSDMFTTNGVNHALAVPAQIIGGSTMLPIREVLESVGYELDWDENTRTAYIASTTNFQGSETHQPHETPATQPERYIDSPVQPVVPPVQNRPAYITIGSERFSTDLTELFLNTGRLTNSDIVPLRYMTNLTWLTMTPGLSENPNDGSVISDLTPLAGLTNLERLNLRGNRIADLTPLAGLTNLRELHLGDNQIRDISPLAGLTNLTWFSAGNFVSSNFPAPSDNQIRDLAPLSGLTNLEILQLEDNRITDLSPLSGLTNLTELIVAYNPVTTLLPISGLTNLNILSVSGVSDLTPLQNMVNLTRLTLIGEQINDLSQISGALQNLELIFLRNTQISDLSPLSMSTSLVWIQIDNWENISPIYDLSPLSGLINLQILSIWAAVPFIDDLSPLSGLVNLESLRIWSAPLITDLSPLSGLANLQDLHINGVDISTNQVTDFYWGHEVL